MTEQQGLVSSDFESLFSAHKQTVFRAARSIVEDAGLAEDITQETFLRLYEHRELITQPDSVKLWLRRVALNIAKDTATYERRRRKRETLYVSDNHDPQAAFDEFLFQFDESRKSPPEPTINISEVVGTVKTLTPELVLHLKKSVDDLFKLPPKIFEHLVAELLKARGFRDVRLVGSNPLTSADIFATVYVDAIGFEMKFFVEVKRWKDKVGIEVIDKVLGALLGEKEVFGWHAGMIVSVAGFKDFEKYTPERIRLKGLELKDKNDLLRWIQDYKQSPTGLWLPNPAKTICG